MEEKIALPPFWGTFGGNWGPGRIISPVAVQPGLARLASFYSITVPLVQFFRCSPCLPWQRWLIRVRWPPYPRLQALRPVEHIFHCHPNVWFFRQAHKRQTKLDDQFLEILTCWTRWQASFFIILKGKTSKPAQMNSSFTKILEAEKNWQK